MACVGWVRPHERQGQDISEFPHLKRWLDTLMARPAVAKGMEIGQEHRRNIALDKDAQAVLFGQRAR